MVTPEWKKTDGRLAARCAAVASFGAGVIHLAVTPMHWRDWVLSGLFFATVGLFQLIWTFFAWSRPTVLVLAAGIIANVGLVALWVTSHTTGAPFGPNAGQPEAAEPAGISVQLLQCYVVMGAAWAWFRGYRAEEVSGFNRAMVLLGANAVMIGAKYWYTVTAAALVFVAVCPRESTTVTVAGNAPYCVSTSVVMMFVSDE